MSVWGSKQTPSGPLIDMMSTLETVKFQSGIVVHTLHDSNYYVQRDKGFRKKVRR